MSKTDVVTHIESRAKEARKAASKLAAVNKRTDEQELALEDAIDETLRLEQARSAFDVRVTREPMVYEKGNGLSWFKDVLTLRATTPIPNSSIGEAQWRLERNNVQSRAHMEVAQKRGRDALASLNIRTGDLDAITSGSGSQFVPPVYLLDLFAGVTRAAGTVRNLMRTAPLPDTGMTLHVPKFTAAGQIPVDDSENTANTLAWGTTSEVVHPVSSFFGAIPVSQQIVDRSDLDSFLAQDLAEQYVESLELELITGVGTGQEFTGLLNVSGATSTTYTSGTPTPTEAWLKLGVLVGATATARKRPISAIVMNTRTWLWLTSSQDANGVPYDRPGVGAALSSDIGAVGTVWGFPVYLSEGVPSNLGGGTNQSVILALHAPDLVLLESMPIFDIVDEGVGANTLTAQARFRGYAAFIPDRYSSSVGVLSGSGLSIPADWS
jgi:HK97 family phage major capsid protein